MINQSSIKYISQLLSRPDTISDGDHSSVALFRQTFPYFVPARYIQAAEVHKKAAFSPKMISEIQPYMGNWILLCNFLEAGRTGARLEIPGSKAAQPDVKVTEKKSIDVVHPVQEVKPVVAEVKIAPPPPPVVVPEVKAEPEVEPVKPVVAEVKVTPPPPPVVQEVKAEPKVEPVKPVVAEVKVTPPPPVVPEIKVEPKIEPVKPVVAEVKVAPPPAPVVPEVKVEPKVEPVKPVVAEVKVTPPSPPVVLEVKVEPVKPVVADLRLPPIPAPVIPEVKAEPKVEPVKPVAPEVKVTQPVQPVVPEVKAEPKVEPVRPVVQVTPVVLPEIKPEKKQEAPPAPSKEQIEVLSGFIPAKVIIKKKIEIAEEKPPVAADKKEDFAEFVEEIINEQEKDKLIPPVYTEDYFLQQGVKVSIEIPEEIDDLKEAIEVEEDDPDKSLMVMMSFSEWLLHFKNTAEKQKDEKKDQKALKTMWQKEKLAAAMEEENEEIPENVFEMAVNSITKEDGLASESLADIYIKQGKYDQAIEMYRKLSLRNPKKNAYFARRIEEVLKEKQS